MYLGAVYGVSNVPLWVVWVQATLPIYNARRRTEDVQPCPPSIPAWDFSSPWTLPQNYTPPAITLGARPRA